jgi:hypothetical protein
MNLLSILKLCRLRKDETAKRIPKLVLEFLLIKHGSGIGMPHERSLRSKLGLFAIRFDCPPLELKGADIDTWLSSPELALKPRNRKNHRDAVVQFTRWLVARHYLPKDWSEMDAVTMPHPKPGEIVVVDPALMRQFMLQLPGHLRPAFALIGFGGLRTQEVIPSKEILESKEVLRWEDIQFGNNLIYVPKNVAKVPGSDRDIPIQPNLLEWLELTPPGERTGPICKIQGALNVMADTKRAVGIPAGRNETHNFLRNGFISARLVVTKNRATVAEEAGTSVRNINKSYRRRIPEAQAHAWFDIRPQARIDAVEAKPDGVLITLKMNPSSPHF